MNEMQHQFWLKKKAVQRKLGSKEDKHIISSDSELDAKLEVLKSIADTSFALSRIIDQYQENLCVLAQEESAFGRFLKEVGKRSKTTGQSITSTGKAMSYSGQLRSSVRMPLLRLQHEIEVFRVRAVHDTKGTIQCMEKERTEYRAALSWMKSVSELDPDTGKGLEKFRTAQSHVRIAKKNFDSIAMDSIQKIDLLAAARCNMFSHALVSYVSELKQFSEKTCSTFENISKSLLAKPKYDFCVLKDLTQNEGADAEHIKEIAAVDSDQSLFFSNEFFDEEATVQTEVLPSEEVTENILIELNQNLAEGTPLPSTQDDLQAFTNLWSTSETVSPVSSETTTSLLDDKQINKNKIDKKKVLSTKSNKSIPWIDLFADLDPIANPEAFDFKLNEGRPNFQQT